MEVPMSRLGQTSLEPLEPYDGKLSSTVLRGESPRKGADLLDKSPKQRLATEHHLHKNMRTFAIILLLASLFAASCEEPPMPPSDEEMIRHFTTHEAAFRKVYEIMSESSEGSFHYPLLSPEEVIILDSTEQSDTSHETNDEEDLPVYGLLKPDRIQLDSLLSEIGCGLVLVDRREWETADSVYVSLVMPYYSHGIVDAGTSKSFVYDPGLESRRNIRITEHGDLNEIYRRTYNDTTLYKPVKEGWYIELDHSR